MTAARKHRGAGFAEKRAAMVARQLRGRGISDKRVLEAFANVPRELFVRPKDASAAYADMALPLSGGQTISQPYMVAAMAEALNLKPPDLVLEIGTGSGYSTAILALLSARVISIERLGELADSARERLREAAVDNAEVIEADGSIGWPEAAPYDAIVVHARVPAEPGALLEQLRPGGRLIAPIAAGLDETLTLFRRREGTGRARFIREELTRCRFVPLIGAEGYAEEG